MSGFTELMEDFPINKRIRRKKRKNGDIRLFYWL
jgi:hypothetical protein